MTKKKTTPKPKVKTNHGKCIPSQKKIRGYNAIKPFLHEVKKVCRKNFPNTSPWMNCLGTKNGKNGTTKNYLRALR